MVVSVETIMNNQSSSCSFLVLSSDVCWGLPLPGFCRLGLAYAGSNREDVLTLLLPVMGDSKSSMEVSRAVSHLGEVEKVL